ncbi:predicted protein [Naegleria gruberi]|uniref:Predicted protein n=1 Tax=Naegleria gruberi TaxID=5762 RepID=D2W6A5_NAEGR|nr:uncharacterized protein NAEGRDRAFT_76948 [Naegleria gruberi]EFC35397.1 predicted protein [Naegleria gruberi]|eukprot:XP_002668141.1 predicted protein [Naegleria gruberi strain NEG-M]
MSATFESTTRKLFTPLTLGTDKIPATQRITLSHRIVMAPLTRCRAVDGDCEQTEHAIVAGKIFPLVFPGKSFAEKCFLEIPVNNIDSSLFELFYYHNGKSDCGKSARFTTLKFTLLENSPLVNFIDGMMMMTIKIFTLMIGSGLADDIDDKRYDEVKIPQLYEY